MNAITTIFAAPRIVALSHATTRTETYCQTDLVSNPDGDSHFERRTKFTYPQAGLHNNRPHEPLAKKVRGTGRLQSSQAESRGLLVSDDISWNSSFLDFAKRHALEPGWIAGNMGFVIKR